jgi:hypothetical protein
MIGGGGYDRTQISEPGANAVVSRTGFAEGAPTETPFTRNSYQEPPPAVKTESIIAHGFAGSNVGKVGAV